MENLYISAASTPAKVAMSPKREALKDVGNLNASGDQSPNKKDKTLTKSVEQNLPANDNSKIADESSDSSLDYDSANEDNSPRDDIPSFAPSNNNLNRNETEKFNKELLYPTLITNEELKVINKPKQKVFNILTESFETPESSLLSESNDTINHIDSCEIGEDPLNNNANTTITLSLENMPNNDSFNTVPSSINTCRGSEEGNIIISTKDMSNILVSEESFANTENDINDRYERESSIEVLIEDEDEQIIFENSLRGMSASVKIQGNILPDDILNVKNNSLPFKLHNSQQISGQNNINCKDFKTEPEFCEERQFSEDENFDGRRRDSGASIFVINSENFSDDISCESKENTECGNNNISEGNHATVTIETFSTSLNNNNWNLEDESKSSILNEQNEMIKSVIDTTIDMNSSNKALESSIVVNVSIHDKMIDEQSSPISVDINTNSPDSPYIPTTNSAQVTNGNCEIDHTENNKVNLNIMDTVEETKLEQSTNISKESFPGDDLAKIENSSEEKQSSNEAKNEKLNHVEINSSDEAQAHNSNPVPEESVKINKPDVPDNLKPLDVRNDGFCEPMDCDDSFTISCLLKAPSNVEKEVKIDSTIVSNSNIESKDNISEEKASYEMIDSLEGFNPFATKNMLYDSMEGDIVTDSTNKCEKIEKLDSQGNHETNEITELHNCEVNANMSRNNEDHVSIVEKMETESLKSEDKFKSDENSLNEHDLKTEKNNHNEDNSKYNENNHNDTAGLVHLSKSSIVDTISNEVPSEIILSDDRLDLQNLVSNFENKSESEEKNPETIPVDANINAVPELVPEPPNVECISYEESITDTNLNSVVQCSESADFSESSKLQNNFDSLEKSVSTELSKEEEIKQSLCDANQNIPNNQCNQNNHISQEIEASPSEINLELSVSHSPITEKCDLLEKICNEDPSNEISNKIESIENDSNEVDNVKPEDEQLSNQEDMIDSTQLDDTAELSSSSSESLDKTLTIGETLRTNIKLPVHNDVEESPAHDKDTPKRIFDRLSKRESVALSPMSKCGDLMGMSPVNRSSKNTYSAKETVAENDLLTGNQTENKDIVTMDMDIDEDDFKVPDELFKDPSAFEYLLSCGNGPGTKSVVPTRDFGKESLFVKFDPLVKLPTGVRPGRETQAVAEQLYQIKSEEDASIASGLAESCSSDSSVGPSISDQGKTLGTMSSVEQNLHMNQPLIASVPAIPHNVHANTGLQLADKPMQVVTPAKSNRHQQYQSCNTPSGPIKTSAAAPVSPAIAVIDRLINLGLNTPPPPPPVVVKPKEPEMDPQLLNELQSVRELLGSQESELKQANESIASLKQQLAESSEREQSLLERVNEKNKNHRQMSVVMEEYERTMSTLISDREVEKRQWLEERANLIRERDEVSSHLANIELSFNDTHVKYERCKTVIQTYKTNEDVLKQTVATQEDNLKKQMERYEQLRQHAMSQLDKANQEIETVKRSSQAEIIKYQAMLKKSEIQISSLQESLAQKTKNCEELTSICDDLINKVG